VRISALPTWRDVQCERRARWPPPRPRRAVHPGAVQRAGPGAQRRVLRRSGRELQRGYACELRCGVRCRVPAVGAQLWQCAVAVPGTESTAELGGAVPGESGFGGHGELSVHVCEWVEWGELCDWRCALTRLRF
jgi:hypothetical protein